MNVSNQFSLREILGNVVPGAVFVGAILCVISQTPVGESFLVSAGDWERALLGFVLAYVAGALLEAANEAVYETGTQLTAAPSVDPESLVPSADVRRTPLPDSILWVVRRIMPFLSVGHSTAAWITTFREGWRDHAASLQLSDPIVQRASEHYRLLFGSELRGNDSLLLCESFVRERAPAAMQEIEQNAAKAILLGNLILPMLIWVPAGALAALLSFRSRADIPTVAVELLLVGIWLALLKVLLGLIKFQWIKAARDHVRIVILAFVVAGRLELVDRNAP